MMGKTYRRAPRKPGPCVVRSRDVTRLPLLYLVHLSTAATQKRSAPPWVKFGSARWVNIGSAPTGDRPQSFFSLNSPSITQPSVLTGRCWPTGNLKRDDNIRPNSARRKRGNVNRKAITKLMNSTGTYSPRDRKLNKHSASKLIITGRRKGFGNRPTVRNFPLLNQGNLAKITPRSSPATARPVPR